MVTSTTTTPPEGVLSEGTPSKGVPSAAAHELAHSPPASAESPMEIVLITGMSGSGKSVALHALEDVGFYCVDNLPPELLLPFVALENQHKANRLAIAMDVRSATSLPLVPTQLDTLRAQGAVVRLVFFDASIGTLVRRYSETRRKHPLSQQETGQEKGEALKENRRALVDAIELERELLAVLREQAYVVDTTMLRSAQLQAYVKALVSASAVQLTLVFESFAFKRGVPSDADFVFDVRMLPNPHYEPELRHATGRDQSVADYLQSHEEVARMQTQITEFLSSWLESLVRDHRSYVTVAIGCTGGQHRSVYMVERLAQHFAANWATLKRHREIDALTH